MTRFLSTELPHPLSNFIGGKFVPSQSGEHAAVQNPASGHVSHHVPLSREGDVAAAMESADEAFSRFSRTMPAERATILLALADALEERAPEVVALESADTGKPLTVLHAEDIEACVDHLRFFAGAARSLEGRAAGEYLSGHTSMIRREPLGVCAQITPWNFPLMMAVWKLAPALAAGNTVVLKPAETTSRSSLWLAEAAADLLPPGTLNVVCGDRRTGRLMVRHPIPALVSLTGSTRAGQEVAAQAGARLKRLHLELGGNAAAIVFADADTEKTSSQLASSAFGNAGQDCVAASRILVEESVYETLVESLVDHAKRLRVGPPTDVQSDIGPLNNADQLRRVTGLVSRVPTTAAIRVGGRRHGGSGFFFEPTVITGVRQEDEIVQQEIFGPVVTVQSFRTCEEALELANGVPQGLANSVWTRDHARALQFAAALESGCVWINSHLAFASEMPHGGFKESGFGKDLSSYALEDYTRIKHVMSNLGS
ncbi:aminobutyraldehyde dehydrogenase [Streptomyces sp. NPDC056831]|uniref:aminobutyraldehyde dehydrogenase n=1 Tax=Streptomyces sp. NPDC056831 TaxID=3345954 RepID=UPI00368AE42C